MNYFNSTFRIKPDSLGLQRSQKPMTRKPMKKKREPPALIRWRRECRIRDNYTCQFPGCGRESKRIDVHHIAKRSQRRDLKFTISNGVCLCRDHHDWTDKHHDEAVRMGLLNIESYELAKKQERQRVA
jgi:hypothetical protein